MWRGRMAGGGRAQAAPDAAYDRAIFLMLDGARGDLFADLLRAGELPQVARHIVEPGAHATATTVFPSVTGVAYAPYLTGCFPQRTNLTGVRWLDRKKYARRNLSASRFRSYAGLGHYMWDRDLSADVRTLFELVRPSSNIFGTISRGTGLHRNSFYLRRVPWALKFHLTGDWAPIDERSNTHLYRAAGRPRERFTFHTTLQIDEHSHHDGPFSPRVREGYRRFDQMVGELARRLSDKGRLERTLLVLGSDHGHGEVHAHFDLAAWVAARGLATLSYPKAFGRRWFSSEAAVMVGGNGMGQIYLRGAGWAADESGEERLAHAPGLVDDLLAEPAVDLCAWGRADRAVEVRSRRGAATVRLFDDSVEYRVHGSDPFGYGPLPERLDRRAALKETQETNYPDGLVQVAQLFGAARTGDLVISAARGYDLGGDAGRRSFRSGHGSLHRDHMAVPVAMNHRFDTTAVRTVDLCPSILTLLGEPVLPRLDGESLITQRRPLPSS